ncbi:MAG: GNAT family N-acetyltransferase [Nitrospirae bacterium]|nr:GNAT family N-acetyltransferase [Candidatus Manganitrophaceae bacterium]
MIEDLLIRPATERDAPSLVAFNHAMAKETEGRELTIEVLCAGVASLLKQPQYGFYLVVETDGVVIGGLLVTYEWSDWRNGLFWWIQSVYVSPPHRGKGVYKRLYAEVRRRAAAQGNVCGFRLYVEKENHRAQQTYRTLGMRETDYRIFEATIGEAGEARARCEVEVIDR